MGRGNQGELIFDLHISGIAVWLDIADVIGSGELRDIDNLDPAIAIGNQDQIILPGQAVDGRIRHIDPSLEKVRKAELTVAIDNIINQQLTAGILEIKPSGLRICRY
ncbi:MAG: hypothetical protein ACD_75C01366G0001 [uncultured bacterium]|nr:MAG: hypothetical protein ACD_75C01366G0001 [uncultured bacterium]